MQPDTWKEIEPHLNEALEALTAGDRDAIIVRYFQQQAYDRVAVALGLSEGAARQRVHRALDRMREFLRGRGVLASAGGLATAIKTNAVQAAPPHLVPSTVAAAAKLSAAVAAGTGATALLASLKAKTIAASLMLACAGLVVCVEIAISRHRRASHTMYIAPAPNTPQPPAKFGQVSQPNPSNAVRSVFQVIRAATFDDRNGTRPVGGFIGYINRGDWLRFNRVDLGPPGARDAIFTAVVSSPDQYAGRTIQVLQDTLDGPLLATLTVNSTGGYGNWRPQSAPLASAEGGIHDVYLRFSGGGWNLDTFKITLPTRPGNAMIQAASFNESKGVKTRGTIVCETGDGYWTRYDGLQFGSTGVNAVAITYACDDAHAGGTIGVHLDRPDGSPAAEMPLRSTGGFGRFSTKLVPVTRITGTHDVYLTFSGKWHGLADVAAIEFVDGRSPATGPAPTTEPASDELVTKQ